MPPVDKIVEQGCQKKIIPFAGLSLRQNFIWTSAGNIIYVGCQWGMLVVIAKLGNPEMVGKFALGLAVCGPVMMLANLQLRAIQATDAKSDYIFGHYLGLRLTTSLLGLLIIFGIVLIAGYYNETGMVILFIGLAKFFESISDIYFGLFQKHERLDRIALSMMIKGPVSLLVMGIAIFLTGKVHWGAMGLVVSWALIFFFFDVPNGNMILKSYSEPTTTEHHIFFRRFASLQPIFSKRTLSTLAWIAFPLGLGMMLISLNSNIPRYFIERYFGARELGIYAAIASLQAAGATIVGALGQSASPRLAKYFAFGNYGSFRTLLIKLVGIGTLLGLGGVTIAFWAGSQILRIIYGYEYAFHTDLLTMLMVTAIIAYISSFLGYGMTAARYFKAQVPLFAAVSLSCALACYWLIPLLGIRGAPIALFISMLVQTIGTLMVIAYALKKADIS